MLNNYAYRLAKAGRNLDEAERYALQAVRLSPDAAHILDTYAYILLLRKNYTLAKLYQRRPSRRLALRRLRPICTTTWGDIYRGLGEYAEAIEAWQQASRVSLSVRIRMRKPIRLSASA